MRPTSTRPGVGVAGLTARFTLCAAPVLAFHALPLPGIFTLALLLPGLVLAATYISTRDARVPGWQLALIALLSASVLWGDEPDYSVERLRTYIPLLLATTLACSVVPAATILRCLRIAFAVIMASSVITLLVDPATRQRHPGSSELTLHAQFPKNDYGGLLVFSLVLVLGSRRRSTLVLAPPLLLLIAFNFSVTAWGIATFVVIASGVGRVILSRLGPRAGKHMVTAAVGVAGAAFALFLVAASTSALHAVGKNATLSDRTLIWAACWQQIRSAPFLGHGAFTFLDSASNSPVTQVIWAQFHNYRPPHPHNGLLDVWGQIGLLGLATFAGLVLHGLRSGYVQAAVEPGSVNTAILGLAFVLLFGLTESAYLGSWLVVTFMCAAMAEPQKLPRQEPALRKPKYLAHPPERSQWEETTT